jgi:hypothetical protein
MWCRKRSVLRTLIDMSNQTGAVSASETVNELHFIGKHNQTVLTEAPNECVLKC